MIARERELRYKEESGTSLTAEEAEEKRVVWSELFCAFCFWGDLILRALEERIVRFDYHEENKPIYVDQKKLAMLRLRMHFDLHRFQQDFKAFVQASKPHGKTFNMIKFTPPVDPESANAIQEALDAEDAAEAEAEKYGAAEED